MGTLSCKIVIFSVLLACFCLSGCEKKPAGKKDEAPKSEKKADSAKSTKQAGKTKATKPVEDLAKTPEDPPPPPQSKSEISKAKMEEMKQLRTKLIAKRDKLKLTVEEFNKKILAFVAEAKGELAKQNWVNITLTEAQKNRLIRNNLEAIQKAKAYQTIITTEINLTVNGEMETDRLIKHLDLDIVILDSFEDEQLDDRIKQLNLTITQIQPKARELAINPNNTSLPSLESVWQEYFAPPKQPAPPEFQAPTQSPSKNEAPSGTRALPQYKSDSDIKRNDEKPKPSEGYVTPDHFGHSHSKSNLSCLAPEVMAQRLAEFKAPCTELRNHMETKKLDHYSPHSEIVGHVHKFDMVCKSVTDYFCYYQPNATRLAMTDDFRIGCQRISAGRTSHDEIEITTRHLYNGCVAYAKNVLTPNGGSHEL